jgi:AcrR family transcriptional regulator
MQAVPSSAPRGRPRSHQSHARIIAATNALLETGSFGELTIEAIAARAGVGKQTIYKWWGGKPGLVMDAFLSTMERRVPAPDTGDPRRDLITFLRRSNRNLRQTPAGRVLAAMIAESQRDAVLEEAFRTRFLAVRRKTLGGLVRRLAPQRAPAAHLVMDLILGLFWYRQLLRSRPLGDRELAAMVDLLLPRRARRGR